jgi:hypothetical protein
MSAAYPPTHREDDKHVHGDVEAEGVRVLAQRDAERESDGLTPCADGQAEEVLAAVAELVCGQLKTDRAEAEDVQKVNTQAQAAYSATATAFSGRLGMYRRGLHLVSAETARGTDGVEVPSPSVLHRSLRQAIAAAGVAKRRQTASGIGQHDGHVLSSYVQVVGGVELRSAPPRRYARRGPSCTTGCRSAWPPRRRRRRARPQ